MPLTDVKSSKRFLADTLSFGNFCAGVASAFSAYHQRFDICLFLLILGALFDGLDGPAARKFGGTSFGVLADDFADAMSYGIAPGLALYFFLHGLAGALLGTIYAICTVSRLYYFTRSKETSDPNYFSGVPSTAGGVTVIAAIIIFHETPALVGFFVGISCAQMVSFDTLYRHLGRVFTDHKSMLFYLPLCFFLLIIGAMLFGFRSAVLIIFVLNLIYGFLPALARLRSAAIGQ